MKLIQQIGKFGGLAACALFIYVGAAQANPTQCTPNELEQLEFAEEKIFFGDIAGSFPHYRALTEACRLSPQILLRSLTLTNKGCGFGYNDNGLEDNSFKTLRYNGYYMSQHLPKKHIDLTPGFFCIEANELSSELAKKDNELSAQEARQLLQNQLAAMYGSLKYFERRLDEGASLCYGHEVPDEGVPDEDFERFFEEVRLFVKIADIRPSSVELIREGSQEMKTILSIIDTFDEREWKVKAMRDILSMSFDMHCP